MNRFISFFCKTAAADIVIIVVTMIAMIIIVIIITCITVQVLCDVIRCAVC